jgi:hypothetical protein
MFNWHNPLGEEDPLWVPFAERNRDIDIVLGLAESSDGFVVNTRWELDLLRTPGWTGHCPSYWIESYDAAGRRKLPCIFADPRMCPRCGCHVFPALSQAARGRPSIEMHLMLNFAKKWYLREGALEKIDIPKSFGSILR